MLIPIPILSKRKLTFWVISFLFVFLPNQIAQSCGWNGNVYKGYDFFEPKIFVSESDFLPYLLDFSQMAHFVVTDSIQTDENLKEWQQKFCQYADLKDIEDVIYKSSLEDLATLNTCVESKSLDVPMRFKTNTFAEQLHENRCSEVTAYLVFAKKCEPHVVRNNDYWNEKVPDIANIRFLLQEGKDAFYACKSPFLRLRYAYQILRLAHYTTNYVQVIELYDELMPKIDKRVQSVFYHWVAAHKAGALQHLGKNAESAYLFSLVFANSVGKRAAALRSFKVMTDAEFGDAMNLCRNNKEKTALLAMRGYGEDNKSVEEMEQIYALDNKSPFLEALLLQQIKRLERQFLGREFNDHKPSLHPSAQQNLIRLHRFVKKVVDEGTLSNLKLWQISDAYLLMLDEKWLAAKQLFVELKNKEQNDKIKNQLELFEVLATIGAFERSDEPTEETVMHIKDEVDFYKKEKHLPDFLYDKLANLYEKTGQKGKAFRAHFSLFALKTNPKQDLIEDLINLCQKKNKTALEKELTTEKGNSIESDLWEIQGMLYLSEFNLEAAQQCFKKMSPAQINVHKFDPFIERVRECINCPLTDSLNTYTRLDIVNELLDLDFKAKASAKDAAPNFFKIGLAYYNMSYFGYAWNVTDYFRSGANWKSSQAIRHIAQHPFGNKENIELKVALTYLEKAFSLSKSNNNKELAAKAAFWALKCQQKMYFLSPDNTYHYHPKLIPKLPVAYRKYQDVLQKDYKNTEFYKETIKECTYLGR